MGGGDHELPRESGTLANKLAIRPRGVFVHATHAPQLRSCNYYVCVCVYYYVCVCVFRRGAY